MISIAENRDCMESMKEFPDKYFDLAVVDPPYGLLESGAATGGSGMLKNRNFTLGKISKWDFKPRKEYFEELFRVSKNQIIWGGNYFYLPPTRCILVWDKVQPLENFSQVEIAWTSFSFPSKIFKSDNRIGNKIHPTQKPIDLYAWIFQNFSHNGFKILDTHLGSGSSRIAAYNGGYDFWGYEIDKEYFDKQEERYAKHISQERIDLPFAQQFEQTSIFD